MVPLTEVFVRECSSFLTLFIGLAARGTPLKPSELLRILFILGLINAILDKVDTLWASWRRSAVGDNFHSTWSPAPSSWLCIMIWYTVWCWWYTMCFCKHGLIRSYMSRLTIPGEMRIRFSWCSLSPAGGGSFIHASGFIRQVKSMSSKRSSQGTTLFERWS